MDNTDFIYFQYEDKLYRRIQLNGKWKWFRQIEKYSSVLKRFTKQWESFTPDEKMTKIYLRQQKLERLFNDND